MTCPHCHREVPPSATTAEAKANKIAREIVDVVVAALAYPSGLKAAQADIAATLLPLLEAEAKLP